MNKKNIFWILVLFFSFLAVNSVFATDICCLEDNGYCSNNKPLDECVDGGGIRVADGTCWDINGVEKSNQCKLVGCVFPRQGQCVFNTKSYCEKTRGGGVDENILIPEQCSGYSTQVERGCCVSNSGCSSATSSDQCGSGESYSNELCSSISSCQNCGGSRTYCTEDRKNIVNINGCNDPTYTVCGGDEKCFVSNGIAECRDVSCDVGSSILIKRADFGNDIVFAEETIVRSEFLGMFEDEEVQERKDGESWCIVYGTDDGRNWDLFSKSETMDDKDIRKKYSAGSRHYIYSCIDGNIEVTPGGLFRENICFQNDEREYYLKGTEFEKYAFCSPEKNSVFYDLIDKFSNIRQFMEGTRSTISIGSGRFSRNRDFLEDRNFYLDGKNKAMFIDNYRLKGSCKVAMYPEGGYFYDERIVDEPSPPLRCSNCGGSIFDGNICGESECNRKGDCGYKGAGAGTVAIGCAAGAVTAEVLWLTLGSAGVHESGGWSSLWQANTAGGTAQQASSIVDQPGYIKPEYSGFGGDLESLPGSTSSAGNSLTNPPLLDSGGGFTTVFDEVPGTVSGIDEWTPSFGVDSPIGASAKFGKISSIPGVNPLSNEAVSGNFQGVFDGAKNVRQETSAGYSSLGYWKDKVVKVSQGSQILNFFGARIDDQGNLRLYTNEDHTEYIIGDLANGGNNPVNLFSSPLDYDADGEVRT